MRVSLPLRLLLFRLIIPRRCIGMLATQRTRCSLLETLASTTKKRNGHVGLVPLPVNLFSKHTHTARGKESSIIERGGTAGCNSMKKGLNQRREKSIIYGRDSSRLRANCFFTGANWLSVGRIIKRISLHGMDPSNGGCTRCDS